MGRTRIELLSSGDIDMYDDVATPLNFAIADIRTPNKRDASFSKTIKIPGTKGNNKRFGHIFDVNIGNGTFNPNIKAPCTIYIDDVAQLSGNLQVLSIDIDDDKKIEYNVSIKGKTSTLFDLLGTSELTSLDFSSGDHIYSKSVQKASWGNNYSQSYCYPLIDYGFDNNIAKFDVTHLFPSIFVRAYIDKIFASQGYTYTSTFFDSTIFKQLIIPCNSSNVRLTDAQIITRLFQANISAPYSLTNTLTDTLLEINNDVSDVSSQYNTGTFKWTVLTSGYYNLNCNVNVTATTNIAANLKIRKNGVVITTKAIGVSITASAWNINISNVYLVAGSIIDVVISQAGGLLVAGTYTFNTIDLWNSVVNNGIQDGDICYLNNTIPQKIKQKDFLLDIIRMFNLFVQPDPNNERNLLVETRDTFYNNGTTVDWTYKLDNSSLLEIRPMGELDVRDFYYSYTDDKDYYNSLYLKNNYNLGYGNRIYITDNEFLTGVNETKVMFSPTPLVAPSGDDRVISKIWNIDASNTVTAKAFNIRILYNGGIKSTVNNWTYSSSSVGDSNETQYLYAGHLDSVTAPTLDLSFDVPKELYYDTIVYTDNNLFNAYHKRYIDLIVDKDSKIVTGYFYLTPADIHKLDFRNTFYFDNQSFYLNKIYDYDPINQQTTKCEFIRLKEGKSFTAHTKTIYGGVSSAFSTDVLRSDSTPIVVGNARRSPTVINNGLRNMIGSTVTNSFIQGNDNYVSGGDNISLINSSGTVIYDGLRNVTLINTNDVTITSGDTLYVGGQRIPTGTINSYRANISQSGTNAPTESYVFNNYIGGVTYSYVSTGIYALTFDGAYMPTQSKVIINCGVPPTTATNTFRAEWTSSSVITLRTHQGSNVLNGVLSNTLLEIIIFS